MTGLASQLSFVAEIAYRSPILSQEQELELARKVRRSGDRRAADRLIRAYLRIVVALAVRYRHYPVSVADLVAEGNAGLVTALRKFDPERGLRFGTYAKYWVRAYMLAFIIRSASPLGGKTGFVRSRHFFRLRRERARSRALFGEGALADAELAERMAMSLEEVRGLLACLESRSESLDTISHHESPPRKCEELVSHDTPEALYFRERQGDVATCTVSLALRDLDTRERFIAERRLMATGSEALTLAEIGKAWGLSRERIRQLEVRTKQKLGQNRALAAIAR